MMLKTPKKNHLVPIYSFLFLHKNVIFLRWPFFFLFLHRFTLIQGVISLHSLHSKQKRATRRPFVHIPKFTRPNLPQEYLMRPPHPAITNLLLESKEQWEILPQRDEQHGIWGIYLDLNSEEVITFTVCSKFIFLAFD